MNISVLPYRSFWNIMQCYYSMADKDRSPSPAWLLYHWSKGTGSLACSWWLLYHQRQCMTIIVYYLLMLIMKTILICMSYWKERSTKSMKKCNLVCKMSKGHLNCHLMCTFFPIRLCHSISYSQESAKWSVLLHNCLWYKKQQWIGEVWFSTIEINLLTQHM